MASAVLNPTRSHERGVTGCDCDKERSWLSVTQILIGIPMVNEVMMISVKHSNWIHQPNLIGRNPWFGRTLVYSNTLKS